MPATRHSRPEREVRAARPGLRARTGLALAAAGAISLFAVHGHLTFIDLQTAGLVLAAAGLAWLWIPSPASGNCYAAAAPGQ